MVIFNPINLTSIEESLKESEKEMKEDTGIKYKNALANVDGSLDKLEADSLKQHGIQLKIKLGAGN